MDYSEDRMLRALDPESSTPGYWVQFHGTVIERAQLQLARRRAEVRLTISRLLFGWSRTVVPAALAAAALAGLLLMDSGRTNLAESDEPVVDILAAGAVFDPLPGLELPTQDPMEAGVPMLVVLAIGEGY